MKEEKVYVRMSKKLYEKLEKLERKTGLTKTEIARYLIFKADEHLNVRKEDLKQVNQQLSRIGNNINQIAKHLNQMKNENTEAIKKEVLEAIDLIGKVKKIIKEEIL